MAALPLRETGWLNDRKSDTSIQYPMEAKVVNIFRGRFPMNQKVFEDGDVW
ncbi:MAG TPA: hypothetical protein VJ809_05805 [Pirellulales bacterium]|jgi:hypothetical protein|nr:hypothetical protein [Pirellulales bacterium]